LDLTPFIYGSLLYKYLSSSVLVFSVPITLQPQGQEQEQEQEQDQHQPDAMLTNQNSNGQGFKYTRYIDKVNVSVLRELIDFSEIR
jgi:hypothetical protein